MLTKHDFLLLNHSCIKRSRKVWNYLDESFRDPHESGVSATPDILHNHQTPSQFRKRQIPIPTMEWISPMVFSPCLCIYRQETSGKPTKWSFRHQLVSGCQAVTFRQVATPHKHFQCQSRDEALVITLQLSQYETGCFDPLKLLFSLSKEGNPV